MVDTVACDDAKALLASLSVCSGLRRGMEWGLGVRGGVVMEKWVQKNPEEKSDLLCIHLSLRINKGNLD